jgi:hypothetical protein
VRFVLAEIEGAVATSAANAENKIHVRFIAAPFFHLYSTGFNPVNAGKRRRP